MKMARLGPIVALLALPIATLHAESPRPAGPPGVYTMSGIDSSDGRTPLGLRVDHTTNELWVKASCSVGGYAEDTVDANAENLQMLGCHRDDYPPAASSTSADGDRATGKSDDYDVLYTHLAEVGGIFIHPCDQFKAISNTFSGAGGLKIVTGSSGKKVYICGFSLTATSAAGLQWKSGTGTNCGTNATVVTGVQQLAAKAQLNTGLSPFSLPFTAVATDDLCVFSDAASDVMGWISYTLQ